MKEKLPFVYQSGEETISGDPQDVLKLKRELATHQRTLKNDEYRFRIIMRILAGGGTIGFILFVIWRLLTG